MGSGHITITIIHNQLRVFYYLLNAQAAAMDSVAMDTLCDQCQKRTAVFHGECEHVHSHTLHLCGECTCKSQEYTDHTPWIMGHWNPCTHLWDPIAHCTKCTQQQKTSFIHFNPISAQDKLPEHFYERFEAQCLPAAVADKLLEAGGPRVLTCLKKEVRNMQEIMQREVMYLCLIVCSILFEAFQHSRHS